MRLWNTIGFWTAIRLWTAIRFWTALNPGLPSVKFWTAIGSWTAVAAAEMLLHILATSSPQLQPLPGTWTPGWGVFSASGLNPNVLRSPPVIKASGYFSGFGDTCLFFLSAVLQPACSLGAEPHWLLLAARKSRFLEVFAAGTGSGGGIPLPFLG